MGVISGFGFRVLGRACVMWGGFWRKEGSLALRGPCKDCYTRVKAMSLLMPAHLELSAIKGSEH